MTTASDSQEDGFDFIRKMWSNMGFNLPGVMTPTLDTDEIERRITDLKAVEGWLKMNLGVLQMTIQGLEVQRATLVAVKAMSSAAPQTPEQTAANPFANPALWTWPFATVTPPEHADAPPAAAVEESGDKDTPEAKRRAPRKNAPKT